MAKLEPNVRELSVDIVARSLQNGTFADELMSSALKKWQLKAEDRALLLELVQGTLRWRGQLDWIISHYFRGDFNNSPVKLKTILELSLYQLKYLDKVPDYAVVSEGVDLAKKIGGSGWGRLVNAVLRSYLRDTSHAETPSYSVEPIAALTINYSHPSWMIQRWLERYGLKETRAFCEFNNRRPDVSLRVNLRKTSTNRLVEALKQRGIQAERSCFFDDFLRISKSRQDITQLSPFKQGQFTIQDESTALSSLLMQPKKGERILDLCAAPGGKACHLAQLADDRGVVAAVDWAPQRLQRVRENTHRLDLKSVFPVLANGTTVHFKNLDKILIDVPCSGFGVLAKRADLRWKRTLEDIHKLVNVQQSLLSNAASMLKKGGILVYSTCTTEPEENENQIQKFIETHQNFNIESLGSDEINRFLTPEGYYKTLPFQHRIDGAFAVRLVKGRD